MDRRPRHVERLADIAWHYEQQPPNGGAPGDAYTQSLNGTGFTLAELVAREAIQNSVDARNPDAEADVVMVDFRIRDVRGDERQAFEAAARVDDMRERRHAIARDGSCCLARSEGPLRLLYVEDYNTIGLTGDPTRNDSNFRKLLMNVGLSDKTSMRRVAGPTASVKECTAVTLGSRRSSPSAARTTRTAHPRRS
jgi:hypothetical protein